MRKKTTVFDDAREELDDLCGDIAQLMDNLQELVYAVKDLIDKMERASQQEEAPGVRCAHCDEDGFCIDPRSGGGYRCARCAEFTPAESDGGAQ